MYNNCNTRLIDAEEERAMTQLVGAICDKGKTVITVSDRMVTTGDMTVSWEQPLQKFNTVSEKAVVLTAGTVHKPDLLRKASNRTKGREEILDIANILKECYQDARKQEIIDNVLIPIGGIKTFEEWHQKQSNLHFNIVEEIQKGIKFYNIHCRWLLAGVDTEGHLIDITNPGIFHSWDNMSFCCIGMGERHADNVFAWYKYSRDFPLNESIYIAFEAKKRAELAGGVGESSDILVIKEEGISLVTDKTKEILEEIYNAKESEASRTEFDKRISNLDIKTEELETA